MNVGIDLNENYAIMCLKIVLISKNDEESTYSAIFSAERAER